MRYFFINYGYRKENVIGEGYCGYECETYPNADIATDVICNGKPELEGCLFIFRNIIELSKEDYDSFTEKPAGS